MFKIKEKWSTYEAEEDLFKNKHYIYTVLYQKHLNWSRVMVVLIIRGDIFFYICF